MSTKETWLQVKSLSKHFHISRKETLKAVDDVSFSIDKGETVGLVGESGCGKSTLGRCLVRLHKPTAGQVLYRGEDVFATGKNLTSSVQMIFQNPYSSLNPRMTVRDIVSEGMALHTNIAARNQESRVIELLEMVGLGRDHLSRFPHEFSGGQRQRIGIARALSVSPEFIVCDEPISALDVSVQAQVINMLRRLQEKLGLTYLFIAHDLSVVKYISDRVIVMYLGTVVEQALSEELYANPTHPYTQALLSAIPRADPHRAKAERRIAISGEVPSPINPTDCCRFAGRCPNTQDICRQQAPLPKSCGADHMVACHLV
jgi:oligopeptide/dipeptide ABC transporter ATP-binding protein